MGEINLNLESEEKISINLNDEGSLNMIMAVEEEDLKVLIGETGNLNLVVGGSGDLNVMINESPGDLKVVIGDNSNGINLKIGGKFTTFILLSDTPTTYIGNAGKTVRVNSEENALEFIDGGALVQWGEITGTLSDQLDLQSALDLKYNAADFNSDFDSRFAIKNTNDLAEGSNLYYTEDRVSTNVSVSENTTHRGIVLGNPHNVTLADVGGTLDHGSLNGLTDDDHLQYALLAGRSGGQTLAGGSDTGEDLIFTSNATATKASIFFGTGAIRMEYKEDDNKLTLGNISFNAEDSRAEIGDPGFEASGINIDGTIVKTGLRVNDFNDDNPYQIISHRHSLVNAANILGARSKSDSSSHGPVIENDTCFQVLGVGWTGSHYDKFGEMCISADAGTISSTSSPGKIVFLTTPDGSNTPTEKMVIKENGNVDFLNNNLLNVGDIENSFTAGSVVFSDGTKLTEDNDKFNWDGNTLLIAADGTLAEVVISAATSNPNRTGTIQCQRSRGSLETPTAILSNDRLGRVKFNAHDGTNFAEGADLDVRASENWSGSAKGTSLTIRSVATGTTSIDSVLTISGDNNVGIGTTTPEVKLQVDGYNYLLGTIEAQPTSGLGLLMGYKNSGVAANRGALIRSFDFDSSTYKKLFYEASVHTFSIDGNKKVIIDTDGNVGIGIITPQEKCAINGNLVLNKTAGEGIKVDNATPTFGWRDLLGDVFAKNTGATKPTIATYIGNLHDYQFAEGDEEYFKFHIPHDWVPGTDIFLHIHWSHNSTLVTGGSALFEYEASYCKGHNQAAFSAPINGTLTGTASTTQYQQIITEIRLSASSPSGSQIDTNDLEPDGIILLTGGLQTNNITSSGAVPDPFIHYIDIHYQSTNIATKDKVPDFYT